MFGVVEMRVEHPAVGNQWRSDSRRAFLLRSDLVARGAARESGTPLVSSSTDVGDRADALRVEEDLLFEVFAETNFLAQ